jgi:DNA repair exonuclease SbcCD ATPase subunit
MKILSLTIENFGPLGSVKYVSDTNSSIVGLVGENGTGKSHVFRAIRYALTGDITDDNSSDTAASYIKDGTSAASVTLKFVKGPHTVTIMRRITPSSSSRDLTIEGPDPCSGVKADKAVREKIEGVFGVDLDAAARCVFIPQGTFTKILFGPWSERESLMADVLGCVDYSPVKKLATTLSGNLSRDLRDIQPFIDLHNATVHRLNGEIEAHTTQHGDMSTASVDSDIAHWRLVLSDRTARDAANAEIVKLRESIVGKTVPSEAHITELETTHRGLSAETTALVTQQSTLAERHLNLSVKLTQQTAYVTGHVALARLAQQVSDLTYRNSVSKPPAIASGMSVQDLLTFIRSTVIAPSAADDNRVLQELNAKIEELRTHYTALHELYTVVLPAIETTTRDAVIARAQAETTDLALRQFKDANEAAYNVAVQSVSLIDKVKVASGGHACGNTCPVCNSTTINIDALIAMESTFRQTINKYSQDLNSRTSERDRVNTHRFALDAQLQSLNSRVATLRAGREAMSLEGITSDGAALSQRIGEQQTLCAWNTQALAEYSRLTAAANALQFGPTAYTQSDVDQTSMEFSAVTKSGSELTPMIAAKTQQTRDAISQWQTAVALRTSVESTAANIATLEAKILAYNNRCLSTEGYDVSSILAENIAKRDAIVQHRAHRAELIRQRDAADSDLFKAREELRATAQVKRACAFLDVAASLFDKKGFQAEHLSRKFTAIVKFVNDALSLMRTGYTVRASATAALEFEFSYDGETWKPMGKLSGGQRVRLTIAFMLAVQATELRNVGLLILDEPSNHVDANGVEALVDMFTELYGYLAGNNMTVFICDHKVEMRRAFQDTITIKKNEPQQ